MKISKLLLLAMVALACILMPCSSKLPMAGDSNDPASYVPPYDDSISHLFLRLSVDIGALRIIFTQDDNGSPLDWHKTLPNFAIAEQHSIFVAQDFDLCVYLLQKYVQGNGGQTFLDETHTSSIETDLTTTVGDVKVLADILKVNIDVIVSSGMDTLLVRVLITFAYAFDRLYREFVKSTNANAAHLAAPRFLDMICLFNNAADTLIPGSGVTNGKYCNTFGTMNNPGVYDSYKDAPWPDYPVVGQTPLDQCGGSCLSVLKFGYEQSCWSGYKACSSGSWCSSVNGKAFVPPSPSWAPDHWFYSGKGN